MDRNVGNKSSATFSGSNDWTPVSEMTEVFNGIVPIPNATGEWFEVQFATPFEWDGTSNIVIAVDENASGHNSPAGFRTYGGTNSALRAYKWSSMDPAASPSTYSGKTRLNNKPIIRFTFADGNDNGGDNGDNGDGNDTPVPSDTTQIEALTVDGFANFKGLTQFDGLVKMSGLTEVENTSSDNQILFINGDGVIQKKGLINSLYGFIPVSCSEEWMPTWRSFNTGNMILHSEWGECSSKIKVGIGTDNPLARLDVRGNAIVQNELRLGNLWGADSQAEAMIHLRSTNSQVGGVNGFNNFLLIEGFGNKRILQLDKDGVLYAREVKVNRKDWSDHVFEEGYELKPLSEVRAFIVENGHLPNIPSEKEVLENGIDLGEMNSLLLEKVEELTLYIFELEDRLAQAETENEEVKELKERIIKLEEILKLLLAKD